MLGMGGFGLPSSPVFPGNTTTGSLTVTASTPIPVNGLYLPAANTVGLATNSTLRLSVSTTAFSSSLNTIIGSTSVAPDGTLHVHTASAGTVTANSSADDLVVENSGTGGISILAPAASDHNIYFGAPGNSAFAQVTANLDGNLFTVGCLDAGASLRFRADDGVTNLTLSGAAGSELTTAAGDVTLSEGKLTVTNTANEPAILINSSTTGNYILNIPNAVVTDGRGISMDGWGSLTTGSMLYLKDQSGNGGTRYLADIFVSEAGATGATALRLRNSSTGNSLLVETGDVTLSEGKLTITDTANEAALTLTSGATTNDAVFFAGNSVTNGTVFLVRGNALVAGGEVAEFSSNSADTGAFTVLNLVVDNTSATGAYCARLQQDAANAFMNLVGTAAANTTDPISTLTTPGAVTGAIQIDVNGTKGWITLRADPS